MSQLYIARDFTTAEAIDQPQFSEPFPGVAVAYVLQQTFMQLRANWVPLPLNTPHPDALLTDYLLVEEGALSDQSGGVVRWTRTYAKLPASYNEPAGNYNYNFIGFIGVWGIGVTAVTGRERFSRNVLAKTQRDFFLVDPNTGSPTGPTYDDWVNIPQISALLYYYETPDLAVDYLGDSPPLVTATTPSATEYKDLIAAGAYIAAENSRLSRWKGNIYVRDTIYVRAQ